MAKHGMIEPLEHRRLLSLATLGPEVQVPVPHEVRSFDLAVAADGSYIIATSGIANGGDTEVSAVRYSPAGEQIGGVLTIESTGLESHAQVSVAIDDDGDAVVAYTVILDGKNDIAFRRVTRLGAVGERVVAYSVPAPADPDNSDERLADPAVSMDAGGGFYLGWLHTLADGFHNVWMQAFDAAGGERADEFIAHNVSSPFSSVGDLEIAATPSGSGAVFAHGFAGGDGLTQNVDVGRVSTTARIGDVGSAGPITGDPSLAMRPDGSFLLAYQDHPDLLDFSQRSTRSLVRRYDADGVAQGEPIVLGTTLGAGDGRGVLVPVVDDTPDGGFVAAFMFSNAEAGVGTLFATRHDAMGSPIHDGAIPLAAVTSFADTAIGADGQGRAVVGYRPAFTGFFRRLTTAGSTGEVVLLNSVLHVRGTAGNDSIRIETDGSNVRVIRGGTIDTFPAADVSSISVMGLDGDDRIMNETAIRSTVFGGDGDDELLGGTGHDSVSGGVGRDKIFGGAGKDTIAGNGGHDIIHGGVGADRLAGQGGRDRLYGNGGKDHLHGGTQGDYLYGGAGEDVFFGGGGHDRLHAGDDFNSIQDTVDRLHGGRGDDEFFTRNESLEHLFGDAGRDSADRDDQDVLMGIETI